MEGELSQTLAWKFTSPSSVDNIVNKSLNSIKDAANSAWIHHIAYYLGIRRISTALPVIVELAYVLSFLAYS